MRLFPDAWFGAVAKVVGKPFVTVYRPLARATDRIGDKLRSGKKDGKEGGEMGSYPGKGKSPVSASDVGNDVEKGVL